MPCDVRRQAARRDFGRSLAYSRRGGEPGGYDGSPIRTNAAQ
jgi:hypothetical protein